MFVALLLHHKVYPRDAGLQSRQDREWSGGSECRLENSTSHVKCDGTTALPITKQAEHTDRLLEGRLHFARSWCTLTLSSALNPGLLDYWAREEKIVGGHIWWYVQIFMIGRLEVSADWSTI